MDRLKILRTSTFHISGINVKVCVHTISPSMKPYKEDVTITSLKDIDKIHREHNRRNRDRNIYAITVYGTELEDVKNVSCDGVGKLYVKRRQELIPIPAGGEILFSGESYSMRRGYAYFRFENMTLPVRCYDNRFLTCDNLFNVTGIYDGKNSILNFK